MGKKRNCFTQFHKTWEGSFSAALYILQNSWFGSIVALIVVVLDQGTKVVKGLGKLLHPPELMFWIASAQ